MGLFNKFFSSKKKSVTPELKEGDIFYTFSNNQYQPYKLLVFEKDFNCYHILGYKALKNQPNKTDADTFNVHIYHFPVDKNGLEDYVWLDNRQITSGELIGYHEYLRQTRETVYYVPVANQYYMDGMRLTDERKHKEAIDSYSKAIDLVPEFFEAIDNRAFCKMDLGLWEDAIIDFKESLLINPKGMHATFSIGECLFNMDKYAEAKEQFNKAHQLDPAHEAPLIFLKKIETIG